MKKETMKMYDASPYSQKEAHSILHNPRAKDYATIFSSLLPNMEQKMVLDAGCGGGAFLAKALYLNVSAVGLDLSLLSLKNFMELLREHNWPSPTLLNADIENLPFQRQIFDMVISWGVLHHTENPKQALKELVRVLKMEHLLVLMLYHRRNLWHYVKLVLRFLCNHSSAVACILRLLPPFRDETIYNDNFANPIAKSYTKEEISKMCENCGLKIEKFEISGLPLVSSLPIKVKRPLSRLLQTYASRYGWCITTKSRRVK